jgi:hypothetical protein
MTKLRKESTVINQNSNYGRQNHFLLKHSTRKVKLIAHIHLLQRLTVCGTARKHTHTHTHTQTAFMIKNKKAENMMQIDRRVWKEHERHKNTTEKTKMEKAISRTIGRDKREFRQYILLHLQPVIASNLIEWRS